MAILTEQEFSQSIEEQWNQPFTSVSMNAHKLVNGLYRTMVSQLSLMFASNWSFKGFDAFTPLAQKMLLQALARYGKVGLVKHSANGDGTYELIPYVVNPITWNPTTGTIVSASGVPISIWNGQNMDLKYLTKINESNGYPTLLDKTNCAFLTAGFTFVENNGLVSRVHNLIDQWAFAKGVLMNNIMTSQNRYILDSANAVKASALNRKLTSVGDAIISADAFSAQQSNPLQIGAGTTLTNVPFQNISLAELSSICEILKREIFEFYGVRQNKDFKRERQIAGEIANQELTQTIVEETIEPFLNKFVGEVNVLFGVPMELVDVLAYKQAEVEGIIRNENASDIPSTLEIETAQLQAQKAGNQNGDQN